MGWVGAVFFGGLTAMLVFAVATRNVDDPREVTVWARSHGVELTAANIGLVRYFVRLVVVLRVVGGLGGWLIGSLVDDALAWHTADGGGAYIWALCGWMVGAWWADRAVATPVRPGSGAGAWLASRRVSDYLPWPLRWLPAVGALLAVVLAAAAVVEPARGVDTARWELVGLAATAVVIAALAALGQRSVVARPQPAVVPDRLAADDAVRATAIHHLGGGATAATLLIASALSLQPAWGGVEELRIGLLFVSFFGALVAWRYGAFRGWRVRR
jgi:hypothetical protein